MIRVWASSFAGLRLTLSPGWYPLPAHITGEERRRLLELIAAGVEDVAYVVELEWDTLDTLGPRLELHRTLALVRVPDRVDTSKDVLQLLGAKLGSVRVGLVQRETPGEWPELAWQERQIKVPLLNWLREQLHAAAHPLNRLAVRALPLDELARHTPEPVELLVMLEDVVAHRMRHVESGIAAADWARSIDQVVIERFASRFGAIGEAQAEALELIIVNADNSVVPLTERLVGARALTRVGLASIGGNDMLLGPLVRFAGRRDKLPRLLPLLPASAWSPMSLRALRRAMPPLFMLPRAVLVMPEPPYARWPALLPPVPRPLEDLAHVVPINEAPNRLWWFRVIIEHGGMPAHRQLSLLPDPTWLDGVLTLLAEIGDPVRLALDVERGRLHRFDTIDHDWSEGEHGPEVRAYLRWAALSLLLGHAHDAAVHRLIILEITKALDLTSRPELRAALLALLGDTHACMAGYPAALESWAEAASAWEEEVDEHTPWFALGNYRVGMRRMLGYFRLDRVDAASEVAWTAMGSSPGKLIPEFNEVDDIVRDVFDELGTLMQTWQARLGAQRPLTFGRWMRDPSPPAPALTITRVAAALELGDWPRALELLRRVDATLDTPEGARARLLDATIHGALGDTDAAAHTITSVREHALAHGDQLLLALSHRALASFPSDPARTSDYRDAVEAAGVLEQQLGLTDALLLDVERTGWALMAGDATGKQYQDALDRLSPAASDSPSLAGTSLQSQLRMIALFISSARARGETPAATLVDGLVALVSDGVKAREISPWFDIACDELIELIRAHVSAGSHADALTLISATHRLVADDPTLLGQLDHLGELARLPTDNPEPK